MPTVNTEVTTFINAAFEKLHEIALEVCEKIDNGKDISCEIERINKIDAVIRYLTTSFPCELTDREKYSAMSNARTRYRIDEFPVQTFDQSFLSGVQNVINQLQTTQITTFIQANFASLLSRVLFVDNNGYVGAPVKGDITKPYQTYADARADAITGDIFWILSDFDEQIILLDGTTIVGNGCVLDNTSGGTLITDNGVSCDVRMIGHFKLDDTSFAVTNSISLTNSASVLVFHGDIVNAEASGTNYIIECTALTTGRLEIHGNTVSENNCKVLSGNNVTVYGDLITINNQVIDSSNNVKVFGTIYQNQPGGTYMVNGSDTVYIQGHISSEANSLFYQTDNIKVDGDIEVLSNTGISVATECDNVSISGNITSQSNGVLFVGQSSPHAYNLIVLGNISRTGTSTSSAMFQYIDNANITGDIICDSGKVLSNCDYFSLSGYVDVNGSSEFAESSDYIKVKGDIVGASPSSYLFNTCDYPSIVGDINVVSCSSIMYACQYVNIVGDLYMSAASAIGNSIALLSDFLNITGRVNSALGTGFYFCDSGQIHGDITCEGMLLNQCTDLTVFGQLTQTGDTTTHPSVLGMLNNTDDVKIFGHLYTQTAGYDNGSAGLYNCDRVHIHGTITTDGWAVYTGTDNVIYGNVHRSDSVTGSSPKAFDQTTNLTFIGDLYYQPNSIPFSQVDGLYWSGRLISESLTTNNNYIFSLTTNQTITLGNVEIGDYYTGTLFYASGSGCVATIVGSVHTHHNNTVSNNVSVIGNVDDQIRAGKMRINETVPYLMMNSSQDFTDEAYYAKSIVEDNATYKEIKAFCTVFDSAETITVGVFDSGGTTLIDSGAIVVGATGVLTHTFSAPIQLYKDMEYWIYVHIPTGSINEYGFFDATISSTDRAKKEATASAPATIGSTSATQYIPWLRLS